MIEAMFISIASAAIVTSILLWQDHKRSPFGDVHNKALLWWLAIVGLDSGCAFLALVGLVSLDSLDVSGGGDVARAALIGTLAPLALRSPVRNATIAGEEKPVGITYLYDLCRVQCNSELDERITRLRRSDVNVIVEALAGRNWTSRAIAVEIRNHVASRKTLGEADAQRVIAAVENALTLPGEGSRLEALVTVLVADRLTGLLDGIKSSIPPQEVEGDLSELDYAADEDDT